jgi:hypothetical protein
MQQWSWGNLMSKFRFPAVLLDNVARAEMTVSCRDCDSIPKVDQTGEIVFIDGRRIQIMHNGVRVIAGGYYSDWMTDIIRRLQTLKITPAMVTTSFGKSDIVKVPEVWEAKAGNV